MLKSPVSVRALVGPVIIALMVLAFGIFMYIESTRRVDALNRLSPAASDSAELLIEKQAAETQQAQSIVFMGGGVALIGITAYLYSRIPDEA